MEDVRNQTLLKVDTAGSWSHALNVGWNSAQLVNWFYLNIFLFILILVESFITLRNEFLLCSLSRIISINILVTFRTISGISFQFLEQRPQNVLIGSSFPTFYDQQLPNIRKARCNTYSENTNCEAANIEIFEYLFIYL